MANRPVDILFPDMNDIKNQGKCPSCEEAIVLSSFKDELSIREFNISGLCQKCQDEMFD